MQALGDAVVHRDEAALVAVIGNWDVASPFQHAEGALIPVRSLLVGQLFAPTCHVQVVADDVHGLARAELSIVEPTSR